MVFLTFKS